VLDAVAASPATNAVPAAGLTSTSTDGSSAAGSGHGLSKGAIAGIVIGSVAGAALLMTLAAFVIIKVRIYEVLLTPALVIFCFCHHQLSITD